MYTYKTYFYGKTVYHNICKKRILKWNIVFERLKRFSFTNLKKEILKTKKTEHTLPECMTFQYFF